MHLPEGDVSYLHIEKKLGSVSIDRVAATIIRILIDDIGHYSYSSCFLVPRPGPLLVIGHPMQPYGKLSCSYRLSFVSLTLISRIVYENGNIKLRNFISNMILDEGLSTVISYSSHDTM